MNTPRILFLALLAACALGALAMWRGEASRAGALEQQVARLTAENAKLSADSATATEKARALEAESVQLRAARAISGARLALPPAVAASNEMTRPKPTGSFLSQLFKDPDMRRMLAARQMAALRDIYSDYLTQAHLTPDETDRFFQLLEDRQMALMDSSSSAMSGGEVDMKAAAAVTNATNDALKDLLGPERFALYQDYEKTLGPRVQVQQLNRELTGEGCPLREDQANALIDIMRQETATAFQAGGGAQPPVAMSLAGIDQYSQEIDAVNRRIYNRAMSVLTAPQLSAFAAFQKNAATTQIAGLKMARQMSKDSP